MQIVFAKGAHYALPQLSNSGYDVVGLDWTIRPEEARYTYKEGNSLPPRSFFLPNIYKHTQLSNTPSNHAFST